MNRNILIIGLVIVVVGGTVVWWLRPKASNTQTNELATSNTTGAKLVNNQEFDQLMKGADAFVLDVHTPEQTHIPGTDAFIPYDQIDQHLSELPADKQTPILVYCRSGNMSAIAGKELTKLGYTQVYDLEGGTVAYKESHNQVSITPDSIALGTVIYGDVAHANFTLTNYTPLPMKITRVSTSCGCTKASVEKEELAAYESTNVNVSFDPAVHKDDTDLGDLTRTIYVETDNPNFKELTSMITATVIKK